jgi:SfnB family sulfur acquisition oxidoreductase
MTIQPSIATARPVETAIQFGEPNAHRIQSDQEAIAIARDLALDFAKEAAERDRDRRLPFAEIERFSQSGLWAVTIPKAYGGAGISFATLADIFKIISAADPSLGQLPQNHFAAVDAIRVSASEDQKRLWFDRVLQGYRLGNAFSEAGSKHVGAFETRLIRDGDGYLIKGEKFYATGALFAHFVHIGAIDEDDKVNLAIARRDAPGLAVIDDWSAFGQRTTASGKVTIDNVRVGSEDIIPVHRRGDVPSSNGSVSQIIQAAIDAGIARAAVEETIRFVKNHARPWIDSGQAHGHEDVFSIAQIGDLRVRLNAAEAMLERAGRLIDGILDNPGPREVAEVVVAVAEAKILTTEIALLATNKLHELGGTRTVLGRHNLDRHWRNARTHTLHDPVRWKYFHVGNFALNDIYPPNHAWS